MTEDNRELINYLNSLGIHDLRNYARSQGVKSPTTLKKDDLIDTIIKVKNKEIEPSTSKMGRRPKVLANFSFSQINKDETFSGIYEINTPTFDFDSPIITREGQIKFVCNSAPILRIKEDTGRVLNIPMSPTLLMKYNLKKDDVILTNLRPMANSYSYTIDSIVQVNGIDINEYNRDKFYDINKSFNSIDYLQIDYNLFANILHDKKILKGTSSFFYVANKDEIAQLSVDFCNNNHEKDFKTFILNAASSKLESSNNITVCNLDVFQPFEDLYKDIIKFEEQIKLSLLNKNKILFVINELDEIIKIINYNIYDVVSQEISPDTITAIRRLINIARYISYDQNLTVVNFSSMSLDGKVSEVIENDIINYVDIYQLKN